MRGTKTYSSDRWKLICVASTALLMVVAFCELRRIEHGNLFLAALPWEDAPSEFEALDATASAKTYLVPAILSLGMIGMVVGFAAPSVIRQRRKMSDAWRPLLIIFLLAVFADLATTIWFFHSRGIDHELHPGIRLFGYAYGRTVGPVAGKAIQTVGVIGLSLCLVRPGLILLSVVTFFYFIAAVYNISQM